MGGLLQPDKRQVGNRIRMVKEELGVSLTDLGNRLELSKSTINSYVQGYSLAPQGVIEQLARISEKSVEWFYFGEPETYIRDYFILKGHGKLLADFPTIPSDMANDFLAMRRKNPGQYQTAYPDEDLLDLWFPEYYDAVMKQYILGITAEFVAQHTQLEETKKEEAIALIAREVYDSFTVVGHFGYGDREKIERDAKAVYERDICERGVSFGDEYLVGAMINILSDYGKTNALIQALSAMLTQKGFSPAFGGEKLTSIFQAMRPALIALYTETTSDEFYDWFGE